MSVLQAGSIQRLPERSLRLEVTQEQYDGIVPRHAHSSFEMMLVQKGYGSFISQRSTCFLSPGVLMVVKPGVAHMLADCCKLEVSLCRFSSDLLLAQSRNMLGLDRVKRLVTHHSQPSLLRLTGEQVAAFTSLMSSMQTEREQRAQGWQEAVKSSFVLLMLAYARLEEQLEEPAGQNQLPSMRHVSSAIRFIHEHYQEELDLDAIADHVQLSRDYLSRCFQAATDLTPIAYLRRYRMAEALRLLKETREPVSRIAARVGIPDASSFSRQFKTIYNMKPSQARKGAV